MKVSEELRKIIDKAPTFTIESLESVVEIARESGVPEQDILHDIEEIDNYFLN